MREISHISVALARVGPTRPQTVPEPVPVPQASEAHEALEESRGEYERAKSRGDELARTLNNHQSSGRLSCAGITPWALVCSSHSSITPSSVRGLLRLRLSRRVRLFLIF